ncbi:MAG: hypothetical protein HC837_13895 [Chloroflexaceae bacterium]|nr:hypothetical protein [Chloroflexaceae bacterium]
MIDHVIFSPNLEQAITQIHAAPHRIVFECAGAGTLALWWLHRVAGSSRTVLEASDRYAAAAMIDLLGYEPASFVAIDTAVAMAQQAYQRAFYLVHQGNRVHQTDVPLLGIACTATLATDRTKRGQHRGVIAVQSADSSSTYALTLLRGERDRLHEELVISQLLLRALVVACGLTVDLPLDLLPGESVETDIHPITNLINDLIDRNIETLTILPDGQQVANQPFQGAILPGSFNPFHIGHRRLAETAAAFLQQPVAFELSVSHPDKGQLTAAEITRRMNHFRGRHTLILSHAAMYQDKAAQHPGCMIIVGYDTVTRIIAPHYYGSEAAMYASLDRIRANRCRFLVAGRTRDGHFYTLDDAAIPPAFHDLFIGLSQNDFRIDLSSTDLRQLDTN